MTVRLNPYLSFRGDAREAMEFYHQVFGGELVLSTFAEFGGMGVPEDEQQQVMHGQLSSDTVELMGSDTPSTMEWAPAAGITVSLSGDDEATLRGWWDGLAEGATVQVPLEVAPWGDAFGMLTDRYGTPWMFNVSVGGAGGEQEG